MSLVIRQAPAPTLCLDTVSPCTAADIDAFWAAGYRAAGRYAQNLSAAEFALWMAKGFGMFLLTESREPGWTPSATTGQEDATVLLEAASKLAIPPGITLVDDCEEPSSQAGSQALITHVDAFAGYVVKSMPEDLATTYVGDSCGLTSEEWYARPNVHRYGKAGSYILDRFGKVAEPRRGWSWVQLLPFNLPVEGTSVRIDAGVLAHDYLGGAFNLVYAE